MFRIAGSQLRVNGTFSNNFLVWAGLHQGSVLRSLLFIIEFESLSEKFGQDV